ncbi:signal peptidase I [Granulicella arctica]|uniref:Signal peptidase I n=1 Tax=Granulicella arctica TaxID=940613 RepID=A0A7Y9TRA2_9BACT|nr:signal peptidase I [Granulicella arctica]NYF78013.1 signal peptidase I [Granulicella arctica]
MTNTLEVRTADPEIVSTQPTDENETLSESLASICVVLVVWLFVMTFVFQNFEIPSASMEKTLLIGDHVIVNRISLAPLTSWARFMPYHEVHRGDIIVFLKPGEPDLFLVKRVIAIPGDRIHLHNGVVYLNGVAQNEPQAGMPEDDGDTQHASYPYRDDFPALPPTAYDEVTPQWAHDLPRYIQGGDLVVPPGKIFALGDNRTESLDGRFWGFVPRANIVGSPLFVYWSFQTPADQIDKQSPREQLRFIAHVLIHFFDETRWKRTLHVIR